MNRSGAFVSMSGCRTGQRVRAGIQKSLNIKTLRMFLWVLTQSRLGQDVWPLGLPRDISKLQPPSQP